MKQNFSLIYLIYLLVLFYFLIFSFPWPLCILTLASTVLSFYRGYYGLLLILLGFALFFFWVKETERIKESRQPDKISKIKPYIDTIEVNGSRLSFRGETSGQDYQVFYAFKSQKEQEYFKKLDVNVLIYFEGQLEEPEEQRNFSGFDYKKYLKSQGIYRLVQLEKIQGIERLNGFDMRLLRRQAILWTQEHFPKPMSSYMTGLLFGWLDKDFEEMNDIYTSLGIIHLFALSGMQVNFFIELLRKILLRLGLSQSIVFFIQVPFSIFYAFITGLSVSILRALLQKNLPMKRTVDKFSLTFILLLLFKPNFLMTAGGQLTMIYSFLLVIFSGKFNHVKGIKKTLLDSTVLAVGVLPLLIFHFHSFQPLSILLTLFFSLIFDFLLLPGLLLLFLLSLLGINLIFFNDFFIFLESIIKVVESLFQYPLVLGKPDVLFLLLLFGFSGLFIDFYKKKTWNLVLFSVLFLLFFLVKNPRQASITMVDVGQGDSILLQDKWNRRNILIDTGGKLNLGSDESWKSVSYKSNAEKTLIPYLKSQGIGTVETLILTHPDEDHMGDLEILSQKMKIKHIYISETALKKKSFAKKLSKLKSKVHFAREGDKLPIFDGHLHFLATGLEGRSNNDNSLVTFGEFYGKKFLFTGDLEEEGERDLQKRYPNLQTDVLKVGHHGSKSSSKVEFLKNLKPKIALISVGKNNRYKHPSQETLKNLSAENIKIYRTDQQGATRFIYKKKGWVIQTVK
ncbi:DNA internalization-related competence protein ComEC/Rec2 [Lactococcus garvieae]|nr:DNA internalization-related competence protein ComEC/Rec2 [Lactococcus garvieae]